MASKYLFWQIYEVLMILMILKISFDFSSITSIVRWKDIETAEKHSKNQIILILKAKKSTTKKYWQKLLLNLLTFINKNIIPVSNWLIWKTTQLRIRMNVFEFCF